MVGMKALERELATLRGLSGCRGDDDRIAEAEAELARLRKIEQAAELACGILWMTAALSRTEKTVYKLLSEALGGDGSDGLCKAIQRAIDAGYEADHPNGAEWWAGKEQAGLNAKKARPLSDWKEEDGPVLWWRFPVEEPPYCGSPLHDSWPGYHTHWTPLILPDDPAEAKK